MPLIAFAKLIWPCMRGRQKTVEQGPERCKASARKVQFLARLGLVVKIAAPLQYIHCPRQS